MGGEGRGGEGRWEGRGVGKDRGWKTANHDSTQLTKLAGHRLGQPLSHNTQHPCPSEKNNTPCQPADPEKDGPRDTSR